MNEDDKPPSPHEDPEWARKPRPPSEEKSGGFANAIFALGKAIAFLVIGIFVLGGLVFATCLLSLRR
jgi:hypothetical protein